ncbi:response regulator transcription factor [Paenibacillus aestuarii]|uniref:Response regulator n=1 Tax=Paenibacillus aestuarii TaxID=516965 RepID=A0ABW0KHH5_9BACL|nr:response regulator [Paenibacillus aestuarii]
MLRILLVDDERTVLNGLSHILNKYCPNYEIVGMAQHAKDALQLMQFTPVDVVITDVSMPEMDGIELTKTIEFLYPHVSVIILSGHADFEFVRQTMKHGACDYLLKPCNYQTILELLQKIEDRVAEQGEESLGRAKKNALLAALQGKQALSDALFPIHRNYRLILITAAGNRHLISEKEIVPILEKISVKEDVYECVSLGSEGLIVIWATRDETPLHERLYTCRQNLIQQGWITHWAISDVISDKLSLKDAFAHCKKMADFLSFHEEAAVLSADRFETYLNKQKQIGVHDYFSFQSISKHLQSGDAVKLKIYLDTSLHEIRERHIRWEPNKLRNELLKELLQLEQCLVEHGYRPSAMEAVDYVKELNQILTQRELFDWLHKVIFAILKDTQDEEQTPHYIVTAIKFMERHYMEEIDLKRISEEVYLNPWYFSSQFKKYMQLSFSEYLNHMRVKIAKQFLKQKDLKVYQVAEMVGFQDAAYFSTVFKSIESMSPKDFQKTVS